MRRQDPAGDRSTAFLLELDSGIRYCHRQRRPSCCSGERLRRHKAGQLPEQLLCSERLQFVSANLAGSKLPVQWILLKCRVGCTSGNLPFTVISTPTTYISCRTQLVQLIAGQLTQIFFSVSLSNSPGMGATAQGALTSQSRRRQEPSRPGCCQSAK